MTLATAKRRLARTFRRNGYCRRPNEDRRSSEGYDNYKKGYEVRLLAKNEKDLAKLREALRVAGFRVVNPFQKAKQWVQPVYGQDAVTWFLRFRRENNR